MPKSRAIVHKDYSSGTPIQISVYQNRFLVWNPGELPPHWTVAKLKGKHPSRPFNPDVANGFFRAGMIETWGRGIERIFQACNAAATPPPEFRCEQSGLWVEFVYRPSAMTGAPVETPVETRARTSELIMATLGAHPAWTLAQLAQALGKSLRAVERATGKLVDAGRLRHVGPRKAGHWEVVK